MPAPEQVTDEQVARFRREPHTRPSLLVWLREGTVRVERADGHPCTAADQWAVAEALGAHFRGERAPLVLGDAPDGL